MNKKEIKFIQEKLSVLNGQPLNYVGRGAGSVFLGFGELVEQDSVYFTEDGQLARTKNGKIDRKKRMVSMYALHIECCSRFSCGDKVVLGKYDIYQPTSEQEKDKNFDLDNFDWDMKGNNRYDELAAKYFSEDSPEFIVKKVVVNRLGDLKIHLTNDFVLDVFIEASSNDECWRFFEAGNKEKPHLVISGIGFEEE